MQWVLTEEEYGKLEEGGDLAQLRIAERIDPFAYRTVPSKQVDTVKNEHRASRAKLAIAEEACLIPEEDWAKLIKAHASNSRRGRSIGPTPSPGEVLVCEICYHVYTLLEKACAIVEGRDETSSVAATAGDGSCGVSIARGNTKPASPVTSPPKAKPRTKSTTKSKKSRRQRQPVEDTQRENAKPNVASKAKSKKAVAGGESSTGSSLSSTKPQSHQQTPLPQQHQHRHQHRHRGTKRPRLLVADGEKQTILTITKQFCVNNYVIRTALNGKECLDILQSSSAPFDVLLLAKDLPTNDAIDITKWLRCRHSEEKEKREHEEKAGEKRRPKRRDTEPPPLLPQILVMTSELTPLDLRSYISVGIDGCICKPLELKQLTKTVTDAVEYQAKRIETEEKRAAKKRVEAVEQAGALSVGKKMRIAKTSERPAANNSAPNAVLRLAPPVKNDKRELSSKPKKILTSQVPPKKQEKVATADNLDPNLFTGVFEIDAATSLPFVIFDSGYHVNLSNSTAPKHSPPPFFNLVVCHDAFDTLERMSILLSDLVVKYPGVQILLWNYPGQAFTSFADTSVLNNEYLATCLDKLLRHVGPDGSIRRFDAERPFFVVGMWHWRLRCIMFCSKESTVWTSGARSRQFSVLC